MLKSVMVIGCWLVGVLRLLTIAESWAVLVAAAVSSQVAIRVDV
jgi:hypothetical protein